jgi:hypothetical protein
MARISLGDKPIKEHLRNYQNHLSVSDLVAMNGEVK